MKFSFKKITISETDAEVIGEVFTDSEIEELIGDHWEQIKKDIIAEKDSAIEIAKAAGLTAEDLE